MAGNQNSGRKSKSVVMAGVQQTLDASASEAAEIIRKHIQRQRAYKRLPIDLQRACEYVIDHAIGKSRQKVEHSGGVMTYKQLIDSASELERKPPEILAEAEEIARKHREAPPVVDTERAQGEVIEGER